MRQSELSLAGVILAACIVSGCGNLKPGVSEGPGTQIFAACEAELKTTAVSFDESKKRSQAYFDSGDRKEGCVFKRRAVDALNTALKSFETGQCKNFHEVASDYISWKVKNYQQRLVSEQKTAQAEFQKQCGSA
jgi:hypothetical protein